MLFPPGKISTILVFKFSYILVQDSDKADKYLRIISKRKHLYYRNRYYWIIRQNLQYLEVILDN